MFKYNTFPKNSTQDKNQLACSLAPGREEAARPSAYLGLSYAHIRPLGQSNNSEANFHCWVDGNLIKASLKKKDQIQVGGGKRSEIIGMSRAARRRMMFQLCMTGKIDKPLFITLTFPDVFDRDPRVWKRHIKVFFQRVFRKFPGCSAFWRLELKKRLSGLSTGQVAPHFHILMWGVPYLDMLGFLKTAWWDVVGSKNEDHFKAGTQVQQVRKDDGVKRYAAKYASKNEGEEENYIAAQRFGHVGRLWGKFNEEKIPWSDCIEVETSNIEVIRLFRLMRRYSHLKMRSNCPSFTLMVNDPIQWFRPLRC